MRMENQIELSQTDITLSEYLALPLDQQLLLTADYMDEYIAKGGRIYYWIISPLSNIRLCPAYITEYKLTGKHIGYVDAGLESISNFVGSPSRYVLNDNVKKLYDQEKDCIATGDALREAVKMYQQEKIEVSEFV